VDIIAPGHQILPAFFYMFQTMSITTEPVKAAAKAVLDALPDDATWEDIQYHLYVRQKIAAGLEDEAAGRLIDTDEMRRRLLYHKAQRDRGTT
jgi:hypothetical protein